MTIAINVKGYVSWDDWGVVDAWPNLMTYEQIVAMTSENWLAELNLYPEEYYNKFLAENHLSSWWAWYYITFASWWQYSYWVYWISWWPNRFWSNWWVSWGAIH